MWAFIGLICLLAFVGSLICLLFKSLRRRGKWAALVSFLGFIVAVTIFGSAQDDEARRLGFLGATDQRAAKDAGVTDPTAWRAANEAKRRAELGRKADNKSDNAPSPLVPSDQGSTSTNQDANANQKMMSTPESYCSGWPARKCSRDASKKAPDIGGLFACRGFF